MLTQSLSGVRGIWGKTLAKETILSYSYAYAKFAKPKTLVIGRDSRSSSKAIFSLLSSSLPCTLIDVGVLPTPIIEHAVRHFRADGGIIITASHNEPQWNGLKFLRSDGSILHEEEMEEVISYATKPSSERERLLAKQLPQKKQKPTDGSKGAIQAYLSFVQSILGPALCLAIRKDSPAIVLDMNGGSAINALPLFAKMGVNAIVLNSDLGHFAHQVEPTKDSLRNLPATIKSHKAAFGAGFDCDADRVEIMLPSGKMLLGNELIALAMMHIASHSTKKTRTQPSKLQPPIVVNNATSAIVHTLASELGLDVVEVEVGETNVVREMQRRKSIVGGEGSSSGLILGPQTCRDGILAVLFVLAIAARDKKPIEALIEKLPQSVYLKEKLEVPKDSYPLIIKRMRAAFKEYPMSVSPNGSFKAWLTPQSFVWLRESKTEGSVLRLIVDAKTSAQAKKLMKLLKAEVRHAIR